MSLSISVVARAWNNSRSLPLRDVFAGPAAFISTPWILRRRRVRDGVDFNQSSDMAIYIR